MSTDIITVDVIVPPPIVIDVAETGVPGPPGPPGPAGGVEEAPIDSQQYARQDGGWSVVVASGGGGGTGDADTLDGHDTPYFLARANHTGTQAIATVSGLQAALDSKAVLPIPSSGVTGLDAAQASQDAAIAAINWGTLAGKPSTFPPTLPIAQAGVTNLVTDLAAKEATANKGAANGYASLDSSAKVPAAQLPSYVDDVLEFASLAAFPATGTAGIIYIALDSNKTYRWGGSSYTEISPSPGSTDAVPEGATNKYYTDGRASAAAPVQSVASRTGAVILVKGDVGLGNVDNTSDANKPVSTATQTALNGKANTSHTHAQADVTNLVTDLTAKAPLASPGLTGTPTAPTATAGTNTTQIATTAFVQTTVNARTPKITVATTAPSSPAVNDLWVDIT